MIEGSGSESVHRGQLLPRYAAASLSDPDPNWWFGIQIGNIVDPDPGSGGFLNPGSGIRNPGWVKIKDPDPG
jgi:hypothetical protein